MEECDALGLGLPVPVNDDLDGGTGYFVGPKILCTRDESEKLFPVKLRLVVCSRTDKGRFHE